MGKHFKVLLRGVSKNNAFKVLLKKNDTIRFKVLISEKLIDNSNQPVIKLPTLEELKTHYQLGAL
jgi:hypothetical protein